MMYMIQVDDDDFFDDGEIKSCSLLKAMKAPLVPEDCTEPYEALQCFTHSFELRYGGMHPLFLLGSLSDVVAEASGPSIAIKSVSSNFAAKHFANDSFCVFCIAVCFCSLDNSLSVHIRCSFVYIYPGFMGSTGFQSGISNLRGKTWWWFWGGNIQNISHCWNCILAEEANVCVPAPRQECSLQRVLQSAAVL